MGVGYTTLLLHEALLDEETRRWLRDEGVVFSDTLGPGRWPTVNELRAVLGSLPGYSVNYRGAASDACSAEVMDAVRGYQGWTATIWIQHARDPDGPRRFSFHKPTLELAITILERLSHICGPFLLVDDSAAIPVVVAPGSDVAPLAAKYAQSNRGPVV